MGNADRRGVAGQLIRVISFFVLVFLNVLVWQDASYFLDEMNHLLLVHAA